MRSKERNIFEEIPNKKPIKTYGIMQDFKKIIQCKYCGNWYDISEGCPNVCEQEIRVSD